MSYIYSKRIKCLDCSKNYRGIKERKRPSYICSGWSNYGKDFCTRFAIEEAFLTELIHHHYETTLIKQGKIDGSKKRIEKIEVPIDELLKTVDRIEVSPRTETFTIYYTDETRTIMKPDQQTYWTE